MKIAAEQILLQYVCGLISAKECKDGLQSMGLKIDLRRWMNNTIDAIEENSGKIIRLEV